MSTTMIAIPYTKTHYLKSIMYRLLYIPYGPLNAKINVVINRDKGREWNFSLSHHKQKCAMANNENNVGNEKVSKEANGSIVEGVTT